MNNKIIKLIKRSLLNEHCEISFRPLSDNKYILVTTTQNKPGIVSENELVRKEKHCKVVNTYRNGKKSGMQIIKTEIIKLGEIHNTIVGDTNELLVKKRALTSGHQNDTAL